MHRHRYRLTKGLVHSAMVLAPLTWQWRMLRQLTCEYGLVVVGIKAFFCSVYVLFVATACPPQKKMVANSKKTR